MREEFFIERKGVRMVLYAGLLDEAHERGLRSITTELIQVPTTDNEQTAIVKAEITLEPEPNQMRRYEAYGDASPNNVARNITPHIIRMAETRAKARALRDAVNVGAVSLEEMGDDQPEERQQQSQSRQRPSPQAQQTSDNASGQNIASDSSVNYLKKLLADAGLETDGWESRSQREVSAKIKELKGGSGASG